VRLEKYELPASDEASTPRLDNLSYLADYAYSEVPPEKKPADIVLDALKDIPIGKPIEEIKLAPGVRVGLWHRCHGSCPAISN